MVRRLQQLQLRKRADQRLHRTRLQVAQAAALPSLGLLGIIRDRYKARRALRSRIAGLPA
jgi:hypothetical protein